MSSNTNPFFGLDDDDNEVDKKFLGGRGAYESSTMEERRAQLLAERRKIEDRTIQSSMRSISLLHESEELGNATAGELTRQREQLQSTEQKLDEINSSLNASQRHIQGIKSVFGGLKNYFSARKADAAKPTAPAKSDDIGKSESHGALSKILESSQAASSSTSSSVPYRSSYSSASASRTTEDILDENLGVIGDSLARLKGLGMGLQQELEEQDVLVDRITDKTEGVSFRVNQQNQQMGKILKK